ncbi:MAG: AAA family ATPase [Pseudomonadota bacterium]
MYTKYWGLNESPFENTPNPKFFYHSNLHEEIISRLLYGIWNNKGACLLVGDIGCGKTTISRYLVNQLPKDRIKLALIENPSLPPRDFLREILYQSGIETPQKTKQMLLRTLNELLYENMKRGFLTVIIIDEAQIIPKETFEEIRLLLNFQLNDRFLLNLVLMGQPELRNKIDSIPQLHQRIALKYRLAPLNREETISYINFRLKVAGAEKQIFTEEASDMIYEKTEGIPRLINTLCDLTLLVGLSSKSDLIIPEMVEKADLTNL